MSIPFTDNLKLLDAVTVTTTGQLFDVSKRQQIVVQLTCAAHASGNGVFTIDGTNDGTNWVTSVACQDLQAVTASTQGQVFVTSKTLSSNTSAALKVPAGFKGIRAVVVITTDGAYTATMQSGG